MEKSVRWTGEDYAVAYSYDSAGYELARSVSV